MNDKNNHAPVPAAPTPSEAWEDYEHRLTQALAQLVAGQFLVLSIDGEYPYVQFACGGVEGSRVEAWVADRKLSHF